MRRKKNKRILAVVIWMFNALLLYVGALIVPQTITALTPTMLVIAVIVIFSAQWEIVDELRALKWNNQIQEVVRGNKNK